MSVLLEKKKPTSLPLPLLLEILMSRRVAGHFVCPLVIASLVACSDPTASAPSRALAPDVADAGKVSGPTDPTATWYIPLDDAALSVQSDHLNGDGTSSVYANGVCNVATTIFATAQKSNSGDATLNTGTGGGRCSRHITAVFPDGFSESVGTFMNLREIENTMYAIPIGATVERQLHVGTDQTPSDHSRCGGLVFGYGVAANVGAGSDSIWVTRVDASTWHAYSKAAPDNLASCKNTGQLYAINVDLTIVSSRPLP